MARLVDDLLVIEGGAYDVFIYSRGLDRWDLEKTLTCPGQFLFSSVTLGASRDYVVTGANEHPTGSFIGGVFVFERQDNWTQSTELSGIPAGGMDTFGSGISISGDTILVGASMMVNDVLCGPGKAFFFERTLAGWTQTAFFEN
ncbi:MAG: hypothetical protein ACI841_001837 [Planctomycetota bacterium]|jgi:hypothetical protein